MENKQKKGLYFSVILGFLVLVLLGALMFLPPLYQKGFRENHTYHPELSEMIRINLNTADLDALCMLPGIGPAKARAILQYRQEHGPFLLCKNWKI